MDVTSMNRVAQAPQATVPAIPADQVAQNRGVVQAVKALNGTEMFGEDNQLMFVKDRQSQRMVVRVVNKKTNEVVSQIPPEYVLQLADDLRQKST
ncbi:conserved hypothetical protein [Candidatus Sulfopaludibacter sp. SbA4]|nr:conserved hypothetical protein [Candidatus Sulfopaludibacter sp. SbA4]